MTATALASQAVSNTEMDRVRQRSSKSCVEIKVIRTLEIRKVRKISQYEPKCEVFWALRDCFITEIVTVIKFIGRNRINLKAGPKIQL